MASTSQPGSAPGVRRSSRRTGEQVVAVGMVTLGSLLLLRRVGLTVPEGLLWPMTLVASGTAVAWSRTDGHAGDLLDSGRNVVVRVIVGAALVATGIGVFAALNGGVVAAARIMVAMVVTAVGVVLLGGPWLVRLTRQLGAERADRIRADERAAVAAHLHDSVLQSLALIQRRVDASPEVAAIARRQERELREWLYGRHRSGLGAGASLASALRGIADEVEADHDVVVDVVVVGDTAIDDAARALVSATREAVVNAAKHAGTGAVSVYGEIGTDLVEAFVRDRGRGFDPSSVPADRRGLADSVRGRLRRHGGDAEVHSAPGEGTEVVLRVPLSARIGASGGDDAGGRR